MLSLPHSFRAMSMRVPLGESCDACGACIYACPVKAVSLVEGKPEIDYQRCFLCFNCVEACRERESARASLYEYLPHLDCAECSFEDCESFAENVESEEELERCPHLSEELRRALRLVFNPDAHLPGYPIAEHVIPTKSGVFEVGCPGKASPLIATSDYLYTVTRITAALSFAGIDAYLAVVPSEGYCMRLALTLGTFNAEELKETLEREAPQLAHRSVILPRQARVLRLNLGWRTIFGPSRLEELPAFIIKNQLLFGFRAYAGD
jgi:CO dehydrogenase/acetyl-CoA synthase gamma subunit (corrinoid Fe-S protein)